MGQEDFLHKEETYPILGACFEVGLLVNFGHHPHVEHERFILTQERVSA